MELSVRFAAELKIFLSPRNRLKELRLTCDGTSSLGHLIESIGVPPTEIGSLLVAGRPVAPSYRPHPTGSRAGDEVLDVEVLGVARPQPIPSPTFLLDVHLGTLARWLRLIGVDVAYGNDLDDDTLVALANAEHRVLLTQDRGILRRRALWLGAYVRGTHPGEQFLDVLDRFRPPLAPWTRCTACNGPLSPVAKDEVEAELLPGTRRSYDTFARCRACGGIYWRGAHSGRLQEIVETASRVLS